MAGDYILAIACTMLSRIQNNDVTIAVSQVNYLFVLFVCFSKVCFQQFVKYNILSICFIKQHSKYNSILTKHIKFCYFVDYF